MMTMNQPQQGGGGTQGQHGPDQATQQQIDQLTPEQRKKFDQARQQNPNMPHKEALEHAKRG
jgi:hypothetical protein